eukprot:5974758-Pyramimonas_sp.AAC.2
MAFSAPARAVGAVRFGPQCQSFSSHSLNAGNCSVRLPLKSCTLFRICFQLARFLLVAFNSLAPM